MKPSLFLAVGCSWVAGKSIDTDPSLETFDPNHVEDPEFVSKYSFAGILQRQLELDQIHFVAKHGANNDEQLKSMVRFLNTNRDNYSRVFVLWGLTSIYRWEMYSATADKIMSCVHGRRARSEDVESEIKYYFSHFWNKEFELERLGNSVLLANGYLNNLEIDHLFFNSFQGYSNVDMKIQNLDLKNFYNLSDSDNDMLGFLCKHNKIKTEKTGFPFLNLLMPLNKQFNSPEVKELQKMGLLDRATAHPTVQAHQLIADELYSYIKDNNKNERI